MMQRGGWEVWVSPGSSSNLVCNLKLAINPFPSVKLRDRLGNPQVV